MELSRFERILQKVTQRTETISSKIARDFAKVKPFDKVPVSDEQQIKNFLTMTPEIETQFRKEVGDEVVNQYVQKMNEKIMRRRTNA